MKQFPAEAKFKYHWRKYQERVLKELDGHLNDNHLHVIAPPGSGKTILGLEVALRLNKPTLILAPSIAIRNQWVQRFCEFFLNIETIPDWISKDIHHPKFLTVSTYQGLHAACSGIATIESEENEVEDVSEVEVTSVSTRTKNSHKIINGLKNVGIGTIVVDEAHHLKNAWWYSLIEIKKALNPTVVGLTATPPYDVSYAEWQRYIDLNGPVDAEISVPELVVEGDLCPHQDYVYFSMPTHEERQKINDFRMRIDTLYESLCKDETLIEAIENHPIIIAPKAHLDWIYGNLELFSAAIIFLNKVGKTISNVHLEVIGDPNFSIPQFSYDWMEILLDFYLHKDSQNFQDYKAHQEKLVNRLKRAGAMERRSISFLHNKNVNRHLSSSISKLKSIEAIVDFEYCKLGSDLRMVILTDYIRKEFLVNTSTHDLELNKLGVLPIFETLRRNNGNKKLGILTGSIVIIPQTAMPAFEAAAKHYGVSKVSIKPLPYDTNYVIINSQESLKHDIVSIVTQVFQDGHIEILTGTKSLLGEGWDAPAINTLILASFVGSYVSSNQMRGRAIRTQRLNADKTGNIWHLVCIDATAKDGGDDYQILKRRFKSFVGLSLKDTLSIENGINRLGLLQHIKTVNDVEYINDKMLERAGARQELKQHWKDALGNGTFLVEEIKLPFPEELDYKAVKSMYYSKTIKNLIGMLSTILLLFSIEVLEVTGNTLKHIKNLEQFMYWLLFVCGAAILSFGGFAFKTFRLYVKYRDISKDVTQIGDALLWSLIKAGAIRTDISELEVETEVDDFGAIYCHLKGGTTYEKSTFIKSLQEIIGTIDNPRYIIIRKSKLLKLWSQKDYHALPELIGRKKSLASYFETLWKRFVGDCELIYTRTIEGRKLLLKSKAKSLSYQLEEQPERVNKWR